MDNRDFENISDFIKVAKQERMKPEFEFGGPIQTRIESALKRFGYEPLELNAIKLSFSLEIFEEVFMKEVSFELNFANRGKDFNS